MKPEHEDSIAIIAMNGRFPEADTVGAFWENLKNGIESVKFFTQQELIESGELDEHLRDNPKFVSADAVLDGMDLFDASFFDFSAREAEILDPQHRLFLEAAWEAFELAGYDPKKSDSRIAVFAGSALSGYMVRNLYSNPGLVEELGTFKTMLANDKDFLATRVSYKLDLMGPSVNVNTLCSSSLVAAHMACHSLLDYHCDIALAGGVSFQISRNEAFFYQEGGIGSSDGHCRAFDAKGNGTVSGSGLGMVVLKRLEDALADRDVVHAVIRGTGMNNDGAAKNSYTAPNPDGQAECIAEALSMANVSADTISYVEAHGTGTNLGDPIEIAGLTQAYRAHTDRKQYCAIGSVKTNIGHLVTAGGVASLIKTVMSMKHRQLPPSLNFDTPNPAIDWEDCPFFVNTELRDWLPSAGVPLRAGVSSFGIGGTNVHLVVEEAPETRPSGGSRSVNLLALSAKSESALARMQEKLRAFVADNPDVSVADLCFTQAVGRRDWGYRRTLLFRNRDELAEGLAEGARGNVSAEGLVDRMAVFALRNAANVEARALKILCQQEPAFAAAIDALDEAFRAAGARDLRARLLGESPEPMSEPQRVFAIQYAFGSLLRESGIAPGAIFAEGAAEAAAAVLAGMCSLEAAAALIKAGADGIGGALVGLEFIEAEVPVQSAISGGELGVSDLRRAAYWKAALQWKESRLSELVSANARATDCVLALSKWEAPAGSQGPHRDALLAEGVPDIAGLVARHWLRGGMVDWHAYYQFETRNRIELPTYPFERNRYWIDEYRGKPAISDDPSQMTRAADPDRWIYAPTWQRTGRLPSQPYLPDAAEAWVVFDNGDSLSRAIVEALASSGAKLAIVERTSRFEEISSGRLGIDPRDPAGFELAIGSLRRYKPGKLRIAYLWSNDADSEEAFLGATFAASAAAKVFSGKPCSMVAVTRRAFEVLGGDGGNFAAASISAVCKLAEVEFADFRCRHVDVDPEASSSGEVGELAQSIVHEAGNPDGAAGSVAAYRGRYRWRRQYASRFDGERSLGRGAALRSGGSYVIAGGLGGMGLEIADRLAKEFAARILILDNREFPYQEVWSSYLASRGPDDENRRIVARLRTMQDRGAEVVFQSVDVEQAGEVARAFALAEAKWGRIDGVFHCAGISDTGGVLMRRSGKGESCFAGVLRSIEALAGALAGKGLDFLALFSGIGVALRHSEIGNAGLLASYEVMDAFAEARAGSLALPVVSINWSDWKGVGQSVEKEALWRKTHEQNGSLGMMDDFALSADEGWDVLKRALAHGAERVAVCAFDLQRLVDFNESQAESALTRDESSDALASKPMHARPALSVDYVAPRNETEGKLAAIWQKFLRIEKVGMNDNFFELGGDSLLTVHLMKQVKKEFDADLSSARLFEGPTVATLAAMLKPSEEEDAALAEGAARGSERVERRKARREKRS